MQIRDACPEDAADVCTVLRRSIAELCQADHHDNPAILKGWLANKTADNVAAWIAHPDNHIYVATESRVIVGVGAVTNAGVITLNYVSPDARFKGISKALLKRLEERAIDRGNVRLKLASTVTARRFYLAAGYVEEAAEANAHDTASGIRMVKELSAKPTLKACC
jgi:GNAT superfamily N-acetyltransferase